MRYVNLIAVSRDGRKVVLITKTRGPENVVGRITFPGGRLEPTDLTPVHAAVREAKEEFGVEVDLLAVALVNLDVNERRSLHIFFAATDISEARTMEDELIHVADIDEAIADAKAHPERYADDFLGMLRLVESQIAFLRGKAAAASDAEPPASTAPVRRPRP